jgi:hypothetical protein
MSTPTIHISEASHRILQELAGHTGLTMTQVLDQALEAYRRKLFLDAVNAGYAALRADPQAWAEVEAERQSMAGSLMDGLDPAESWGEDGDLLPPGPRESDG